MATANNTLEETIGLTVAANDAMQDPASTGTALRTIALRLRDMKVELADAGLETDGMATSTAKLQESLKQLAGVDILEDGGTAFKSTFQIMRELAGAWDNISDMNRAAIIKQVAGKRGASYFSSMMMNWEDAENAYKEAMNSAGSAVKENEAFLDSIEGRKRVFKSAFESLSNNLLNGDLVKTGISAGTQIVKGLDFAVKHTGGGTFLLGGGMLLKSVASGLTKTLMSDSAFGALTDVFSNVRTFGIKSTVGSLLKLLTPMQATLGAIGVAAATVGIAYKVWDVNTVQLSEAHEKLNDSLSNVSSAQQHIATIEEQISANEEKISQIRKSGATTITKTAELSNLQKQNELLKIQQQYQQTIADTESLKAASSARLALNISGGYVSGGGTSNDGVRSDKKVGKFTQFLRTIFFARDNDLTETEYALRTAEDYSVAQQRLNEARLGQFVNKDIFGSANDKEYDRELEKYGTVKTFKTQQEAVEFWEGQTSSLYEEYATSLSQQYKYLESFTDQSTGKALKGYEEDFQRVRDNINSLQYKTATSDESFLNYLLGSSTDYDKVSSELANLALNDGFVKGWEDSSKALGQFINEANSAGMTNATEKIENIWKSMASGSPNAALSLVEDNYESLTLSMKEYETRSTNVLKAAKAGFSVGGLDVESRNTLFGSYQEAMMDTQNGIRLDYRLFDKARARNASKEIGENTSELRTQQKLLATLKNNYAEVESQIEEYSKRPTQSASTLESFTNRANELKQEMSIVKSNISNLRSARSELNGLNSEVYQYMNAADGSYNQSAVTDALGESYQDLIESVESGKTSSAAAREFIDLWTFDDQTGKKNSEIVNEWGDALGRMQQFFDPHTNGQGTVDKWILNDTNLVNKLREAEQAMNVSFLDSNKNIKMNSSHLMNLAKYLDISKSNATELINALADYGYNVEISNTATDFADLASNAGDAKEVLDSYGVTGDISKYIKDYQEALLSGKQYDTKDINAYIDAIQKAREEANTKGDGASTAELNEEMAFALEQREIMARTKETASVMARSIDEMGSGAIKDGISAMQQLQSAYDTYNASAKAYNTYGIDVDIESSEGELNSALAELADYVQEQDLEAKIGLDEDASSTEIQDKLSSLLKEGGVGKINGKLDISDFSIVGGEVAEEKASEVAQRIAEAINTTLTESKSALDSYLGEGNYQVELDAQGNIVSVTVADTAEIPEVPVTADVQGYDMSGVADKAFSTTETKVTNQVNNVQSNVTATTSGQDAVESLKSSVAGVADKAVDIKANTIGQAGVDTLRSTINAVNSKDVTISAATSGVGEVTTLAGAIAGVQSKSVTISVNASVSGVAQQFLGKAGFGVNGTAHFGGTAYSTGNWGVSKNETALLGEVGSELVVNPKTGTWHTVDRASFERLPKGAIVFNHKQTEELFKNGYVTSGGGHGRVVGSLLNGTAHASGTALAEGSDTKNNDVDFISIRLKRLADALDRLTNTAELYENFEEKNLDMQKAIAKAYEGVNENLSAYNAYMAKANSVGLDESYASKVRNGSMDIENIEDDDLRTKITDYQKWYEAAEAVQDTIISLKKQVKELAKQKFDNITKSYDSFLSLVNAIHDKYSAMNDLFEEMEGRQSIEYLQEMGGQNNSAIARLRGQISELLTELHEQETTTALPWSEAWVEAQAKINETKKALYEARLELQEVNNEIRKTNWVDYNNLTAQLEAYGDEVYTVYNLIGDLNSFESANAAITQNGISKLGVLTSSLKNARQQVANYETAYEALNKELQLGVINEQEYQDELLDLQKSQRGAVESVKKYKDEIVSLIKDGINAETEAFQKLIEARKKDLSKQKEADDYAKTVADKTKDINRIRAQVAALSGDDSQATKARIKSLQADLLEMEEDLAETRRDHEYNTMVEAYDDEVEHFGEIQDDKIEALTASLAHQNEAISSALTLARDNYATIYGQLNDLVEEYGISLSSNLVNPWTEATDAINEYQSALKRATSNANISSGGYVSETDNQSITHYGNNGVSSGNYKSLYNGTAIMDSASMRGTVLGFIPKGSLAESDGATHSGWIHVKYNGVWGWTSIGNLQKAARGTFNASKGLTLTDEYGLGSEAIITKQGVLRQLNSGDMVFNASQKSMLWKLSQMDVPTMVGDLALSVGALSRLGGENSGGANISMNYGSLLTVNGNVDRDALPDLEGICKAASEYIKKDITSTFRKIGVK